MDQTFSLRMARHPSETLEFMLTRFLAYCLEYTEGITLTDGVSAGDYSAVLVRDLTGRVTGWIEVGMPDAKKLHRGSKLRRAPGLHAPHRREGPVGAPGPECSPGGRDSRLGVRPRIH